MTIAAVQGLLIALTAAGTAQVGENWPPVAITHVTIHNPGAPAAPGTIVIAEGRIVAAGTDVKAPADAQELDATGLHAYPGFIDALASYGVPDAPRSSEQRKRIEDEDPDTSQGPAAWTQRANRRGIHPEWKAREVYAPSKDEMEAYHKTGFTAVQVAPRGGLLEGTTALVNATDAPRRRSVLRDEPAACASFATGEPGDYPFTVLGCVASMRQFLYDTDWFGAASEFAAKHADAGFRLPEDDALAAMLALQRAHRPVIFEANKANEIHRALDLAAEFKLTPWIAGGREAFKVLDRLRSEHVPVIVSLKFDEEPPAIKADAPPETDPDEVRDQPLRLRTERRRLWEERVNNLRTLADAGVAVAVSSRGAKDIDEALDNLRKAIKLGLPADAALAALTSGPAKMLGVDAEIGAISPGKIANIALFNAPFEKKEARMRYVFVDGKRFTQPEDKDAKKKDDNDNDNDDVDNADSNGAEDKESGEDEAEPAEAPKEPAPDWSVELEADRVPRLHTGGNVLLTGATIYPITSDPLENASILVKDGRIAAIGKGVAAPAGVTTIDATGWHIMPGIIDCHSHLGIEEVNEYSASVTAEVRVADVIDPYQVEIYRALAGGATTAHTMHGSSNTIGGQNVVMKMRYKALPGSLPLKGAPRSIKFALGENVTGKNNDPDEPQSRVRFPHSRMGVESVLRQAFTAAGEYRAAREAANSPEKPPFRRDLRLDALCDVLDGKVWVHCHGYRADEYLRLLSVAEDFGFRIAVLHHCLEAYRIMPEIARHGCAVSTFADDWAYKLEAYDATAYNAATLVQHNISTTVNSDSESTIRFLNVEAGKTVRWGGLSQASALALVTINAARQLGIADRVGSLEVGKDADLACFNGPPLDSFSANIMTFVDGEMSFQHPRPPVHPPIRPIQPALQNPPAVARSRTGAYAIINGTVHTMAGPAIEKGNVIIRDGRITAAGADASVPADAAVIDAAGEHVWPGLIDASSLVGLREILLLKQTRDEQDTARIEPELRAASTLNPFSVHVECARAVGITTVLSHPTDGWISGQSALVDLAGWSAPEMIRRDTLGLHVGLPTWSRDLPKKERGEKKKEVEEQIRALDEFFETAALDAAVRGKKDATQPPRDLRREALAPYVRGEQPVIFRANSYREIKDSLDFAARHKLRAVIDGGREAWKCAAALAEQHVPVILTTVTAYPAGEFEPFDSVFANGAVLAKAGVKFCFGSGDAANAMDLPIEVGMAVANGLDPDRAVESLTRGAAEILGVDGEIGTIAPGKVANIIVTTDYPIQVTAGVTHEFIRGEPVSLDTVQTRQIARFRERPEPKLPPQRELKGPPRVAPPLTR